MIKEALQYIVGLGKADILTVEFPKQIQKYSDKPLHRLDAYYAKADYFTVNSLTSLIEYIRSGVDRMDEMILHIVSPTRVEFFSVLNPNRDRETLIVADAKLPRFSFDTFLDHEQFIIGVQSKFVDNEDKSLLLKFAGTVEAGTVAQYGDDGVSQKATVRTGVAGKTDAIIPSPLMLQPYRTFLEVAQPESQFIFRMRGNNNIQCALYNADGGAWEISAKENISTFLKSALNDIPGVTILS